MILIAFSHSKDSDDSGIVEIGWASEILGVQNVYRVVQNKFSTLLGFQHNNDNYK